MAKLRDSLKVLSVNCQGLRNKNKRSDVLSYLKDTGAGIICLQDTHLTEQDLQATKMIWNNECYLHGQRTNARGVGILINNNFEHEVIECNKDTDGNYLQLIMKIQTFKINLITIYAPNIDRPEFFNQIRDLMNKTDTDYIVVCGDFNLVLNPQLDSMNYKNINHPRSRQILLHTMDELNLIDTFRYFHPHVKRYSWRKRNPVKQARLDFFLTSNTMSDIIDNCYIRHSYRSDHSIIELSITLNNFEKGKGVWKLNVGLLKNPDYVNLVNRIIEDEKLKYALPVYNIEYIKNTDKKLNFSIDPDKFLEMIYLRVRGETIKFASHLKNVNTKIEKKLIKEIENMESQENTNLSSEILNCRKQQLEKIREEKIQGQIVRSRMQWLSEGERPSKFFCKLENKNFIEKTIKKLKLDNGTITTNQQEILENIGLYYKKLFQKREMYSWNWANLISEKTDTPKITASHLGDLVTSEEMSDALSKMKNNKSPGIDGIPADFLKVFWRRLKFFVTDAINSCYKKGTLSTTLKQSIITCLPKGNKDRKVLKNWRPISLLCATYKLASSVIAN